MKLGLGIDTVLFKQLDILFALKARHCIGSGSEVEKPSLFSLCAPLIRIAVAVEDDICVFLDSLFDKVIKRILEVICFFKDIGKLIECFCNYGIYHGVGSCNGEP